MINSGDKSGSNPSVRRPSQALGWLTAGLLALVALRLAVDFGRPIFTDDLWWHLKLGEILIDLKGFPRADPFLIRPNPGPPFFHEWLFQVGVGMVERFFGLPGVRIAHVLVGFACLLTVAGFVRSQGFDRLATAGFIALFVLLAYHRIIQFRPHLVSIIFFYLVLQLVCVRALDWKRIGAAGVVMLVWANVHSIALVALPFVAAHLGALALSGALTPLQSWRRVWVVAGLAAIVAINPRGLELYYFYFTHDANNPLIGVPDEWGRLWPRRDLPVLPWNSTLLMTVISAHALLLGIAVIRWLAASSEWRRDPQKLFLASAGIISVAFSFFAVRFVWMLPLAAMAIVELRPWPGFQRLPDVTRGAVPALLGLLVLIHVSAPATRGFRYPLTKLLGDANYFETHADPKFMPGAVEFLASFDGGHIYNPYRMGGYLAWRLGADFRTMLDGRFNAYPQEVNDDFMAIRRVDTGLRERIDRYAFDFFMLPIEDRTYRPHYALRLLGWRPVLHDSRVVILMTPERTDDQDVVEIVRRHYRMPEGQGLPDITGLAERAFLGVVQPRLERVTLAGWSQFLRQALLNQMFGAAEALVRAGDRRFGSQVSFAGVLAVCETHAALEQRFGADGEYTAAARELCTTAAARQANR